MDLNKDNANINIIKNSVARFVFNNLGMKDLIKYLEGMNAIVYGDDPVILAKKLLAFIRKNKILVIKCALVEGRLLESGPFSELSRIPTRDELLGIFSGLLSGLFSSLVATINRISLEFMLVLKAIEGSKDTKDKG
jgi:large subunit ribosomal protein L10